MKRYTRESTPALWALPAAMPEGAQRAKAAGMARFVDAEAAAETALPAAASGVSAVRRTGGGLSLGGAVGASGHGAVQCGSATGSGAELAGNGPPVRIELEECGDDRETGSADGLKHRARPPV